MNLGSEKLILSNINKRQLRIKLYNDNPKKCKKCKKVIPYEKRMNDYCNSSCFASMNNIGICRNKNYYDKLRKPKPKPIKKEVRKKVIKICKLCGKENLCYENSDGFCNYNHARLYKTKYMIDKGEANHSNKHAVRSYLIYFHGGKCEQCNNNEWFGCKLSLEMHHIDGDVDNMRLKNLKLLCPNCHGITDNYKSKNKHKNSNRKMYKKK
jgi:hypothetical protein